MKKYLHIGFMPLAPFYLILKFKLIFLISGYDEVLIMTHAIKKPKSRHPIWIVIAVNSSVKSPEMSKLKPKVVTFSKQDIYEFGGSPKIGR